MPMGRDAWGHGCSISDSRNQDLTFEVKLTALPWLISLFRLSDRSRRSRGFELSAPNCPYGGNHLSPHYWG